MTPPDLRERIARAIKAVGPDQLSDDYTNAILALLREMEGEGEGWKLCPREATERQVLAMWRETDHISPDDICKDWYAGWDAAPSLASETEGDTK